MKLLLETIFGKKEGIEFNLFDSSKTFLNFKEEANLLIVQKKGTGGIFMLGCGLRDRERTTSGLLSF